MTETLSQRKFIWLQPERDEKEAVAFYAREEISLSFRNLKPDSEYSLLVNTWQRDWYPGEVDTTREAALRLAEWVAARWRIPAATALSTMAAFLTTRDTVLAGAILPLFSLSTGDSSGGSAAGGTHCFLAYYKSRDETYRYINTFEPRYKSGLGFMELPQEAVRSDGTMELRIRASARHKMAGVFLLPKLKNYPVKPETLSVKNAFHRRQKMDFADILRAPMNSRYLHSIPGDVTDVEFELPRRKKQADEKETYLLRAGGFYTMLSSASKKLAGNWEERISEEARERLRTMVPAKDYFR